MVALGNTYQCVQFRGKSCGPNFPSLSTTSPNASLIDAASDPECGAVKPKQGTNSPVARRGRK